MPLVPADTALPLLLRSPGAFASRYRFGIAVLTVGAIADALTTIVALQRFGAEAEVHLVQRFIVQTAGPWVGVPLAKTMQVAFVIPVAAWWRPWCPWILSLCGALYAAAAISKPFVLL